MLARFIRWKPRKMRGICYMLGNIQEWDWSGKIDITFKVLVFWFQTNTARRSASAFHCWFQSDLSDYCTEEQGWQFPPQSRDIWHIPRTPPQFSTPLEDRKEVLRQQHRWKNIRQNLRSLKFGACRLSFFAFSLISFSFTYHFPYVG